jgi:hypothetical protein
MKQFFQIFIGSLWLSQQAPQPHSSSSILGPALHPCSLLQTQKNLNCGSCSVSQCVPRIPFVYTSSLANVHCNESLVWYECSGFCYSINTGTSVGFLRHGDSVVLDLEEKPLRAFQLHQWGILGWPNSKPWIWAWEVSDLVTSPALPLLFTRNFSSQGLLYLLTKKGAGPALPSVAAGEGYGQFSHSCDPRGSSPICHRWWGMTEGRRASFSHQHHLPADKRHDQLSCPHSLGTDSPATPMSRNSLTMLPKWHAGPATPSAIAGEGQSHHSCSHDFIRASLATGGKREGRASLPPQSHCTANKRQGRLSCTHAVEAGSSTTPHIQYYVAEASCSRWGAGSDDLRASSPVHHRWQGECRVISPSPMSRHCR